MRILGLDPGLQVTGYAVLEVADRGPVVCEAGVIRSAAKARRYGHGNPHPCPFTMGCVKCSTNGSPTRWRSSSSTPTTTTRGRRS